MEQTEHSVGVPATLPEGFVLCDAEGRVISCDAVALSRLGMRKMPSTHDELMLTIRDKGAMSVRRVAEVPLDGGRNGSLYLVLATAPIELGRLEQRRLVDLSPDLIAIVSEGRIDFVNRSGAVMLGAADSASLIGAPLTDILVDGERNPLLPRIDELIGSSDSMRPTPGRLRTRQNALIDVEVVGIPFHHRDRHTALLIARDVTGHLATQKALRHSVTLLESTLESTADAILVIDTSGRVVFHNARFARMIGTRKPEEFLERLRDHVSDRHRLNRHFELSRHLDADVRDELRLRDDRIVETTSISWRLDGEVIGRVISFREVTERRKNEEGLLRREQILQAVAYAAEQFLTNEWQTSVNDVLRRLGQATSVSRVYLFENHLDASGEEVWSQRAEWAAPGVSPQIANPELQELSVAEMFSDWQESLSNGQIVDSLVREMPTLRRELMEAQNILSLLLVPITVDRQLWGFLGFDDCSVERVWTSLEIDALRTASRILGGAFQKKNVQDALRRSEERYRNLFEKNLAGVFRNTTDGRIVDCNDACARIFGYDGRDDFLRTSANSVYFESAQRELVVDQLRRVGSLTNAELCLRRRDGRLVWVLENVNLREENGVEYIEGTVIDITDRKRAEEALRESEERYRLMADSTTDIISRHTAEGVFLYASPACRTLLGFEPHELVGRLLHDLVHPEDLPELEKGLAELQTSPDNLVTRYRLRRRDGRWTWFETTSRMIRNHDSGDVHELICVSRDISERKRVEERIEHQAYHDALTGLPNRSLFQDRVTMAMARSRRTGKSLAILFLDLDYFKDINDTFGHTAGDRLLQEIAARLRVSVRDEDTVARIGGDEFLILLVEVGSEEDARAVADKLLTAMQAPVEVGGRRIRATGSVGMALFPANGEDPDALVEAADRAMYQAKSQGRNTVVVSRDPAPGSGSVPRQG